MVVGVGDGKLSDVKSPSFSETRAAAFNVGATFRHSHTKKPASKTRIQFLRRHRLLMSSRVATWIAFGAWFKAAAQPRSQPECMRYSNSVRTIKPRILQYQNRSFSSGLIRKQGNEDRVPEDPANVAKRKGTRTPASNTSLKRISIEAQRSRQIIGFGRRKHVNPDLETKEVTAYCAAETYNIAVARHILKQEGYELDPFHTDLYPQVLHVQTRSYTEKGPEPDEEKARGVGDVFIFPSGTVVTWNVAEPLAHRIVSRWLPKAAVGGHLDKIEVEDLRYIEDPTRESSRILGDTILLGTKATTSERTVAEDSTTHPEQHGQAQHEIDTVLAKIAFSSALARSTKLAVLENLLNTYFETTRSIPTTLSAGSRLRFSRAFILKKTGELLSIRAQLNLYSELTDSLPDLFWDSPHELGLENYYEQVGRALDVGIRIKVLNERMDYASEIAAVLRERLSERHSTELEWLIIGLISIEVLFEIRRLWKESKERVNPESTDALLHEYLKKELRKS